MIFVVLFFSGSGEKYVLLVWWLALPSRGRGWPFHLRVGIGPVSLVWGLSLPSWRVALLSSVVGVGPPFSVSVEVGPSWNGGWPLALRSRSVGIGPTTEDKRATPKKEETTPHTKKELPTSLQQGKANPNPKKEGSTTSIRKTDGPEKGGPALTPRRKGQNPNPKKAGPTRTPRRKGQPPHPKKEGPTTSMRKTDGPEKGGFPVS